jgi:hypothetical protein
VLLGERKGRCQLKAGTAVGVGSIREVQRQSVLRLKKERCLCCRMWLGVGAWLKYWDACCMHKCRVVLCKLQGQKKNCSICP